MNDYGYDKAPANAYPALIKDAEDNQVVWQETFSLKVGSTTTNIKNDVTIELSDDFSKGTYKVKNMFKADLFFGATGMVMNAGADYYADLEDDVLTIYKAEHPSYHFGGNVTLKVDLSEMTITSSANINCTTAGSPQKAAEIVDYKLAIPSESEGGEESPYAYLFGELKESFADGGYQGNPKKGTLVIEASDDPAHHLLMTFFSGNPCAVTVYADVSADGKYITTVQPKGYTNMGKFYSSTLDVYAAGGTVAIWGTLKFDYPTISDYSASR
jgi:hypothetical protein